jgi:hypothetical protein
MSRVAISDRGFGAGTSVQRQPLRTFNGPRSRIFTRGDPSPIEPSRFTTVLLAHLAAA